MASEFGEKDPGARDVDNDADAIVEAENAIANDRLDTVPEPLRPTVRPAATKSYGPPSRRLGLHSESPQISEPTVFGVSIRAIALIAAIAAAVSLFASVAVSCGMQSMLQHSIDSSRHDLESQIDERITAAESQIDKIIDEYNSAAEAASTAEEASSDLAEARESLRQTVADARAWLESGGGRWIGSQTKTMMLNALETAQNLIDESGISDPQTYQDAAGAIEDIIDDVEQGTLW